nr:hypothetical protein [Tanacetum cinerariifolium]
RPYRTHPDGSCKFLTARKRVGPFPARRLAWRRVSHHSLDRHSSPDFTSDSSSSGSSSDSTSDTSSGLPLDSLSNTLSVHSSGCDALGQTHSGPSTKVASSRPSCKRCRSPTTSVSSSTLVSRSIAPTHADLLPPPKRFRDLYSLEDGKDEHMEIGTSNAEAVADFGIGDRVDTEDGIGMGVKIAASDIREDDEEFEVEASAGGTIEAAVDPLVTGGIFESTRGNVHDLEGTLYDIVHYMSKVPLDRITEFETIQRQLEAGQLMASEERAVGQLMASEERAVLTDKIRRLGLENLKIRRNHDDARRKRRRLESFVERPLGFCP